MSNYIVNDTSLTSIANAIRTKGGTSEPLEFPDEFVTAIGAISGGGEPSESYYCYFSRSLTTLHRAMGFDSNKGRLWLGSQENQRNRRTVALTQPGASYNLPFMNYTGWTTSLWYPIPIPQTANRIAISGEPSAVYINGYDICKVSGSAMSLVKSGNGSLPATIDFTADSSLVFGLNLRPNPDATDFGANEPTKVEIKFETV